MDVNSVLDTIVPFISTYGLKVIGAIVILILGRIGAGITRRIVGKILRRANVNAGVVTFATSLSYALILTMAVLASLSKFGVETTSFVAVLGAVGFAVGFALQGSLSNFAAGVLVLVLRPYHVGDVIEAAGVIGKVVEIQLFNTVMNTADNIRILVPNAKIQGDVIKNITWNPTRRLDLVIGIGYDSSMKKARDLMQQVLNEDPRVLPEPAPAITVGELGDSSVNFNVRPWVKKEDYWDLRFALLERIKEVFDENGIEIPFPQRTVHMATASGE
jgi:small conductance mechanosensitive channel